MDTTDSLVKSVLQQLRGKHAQDYTYISLFFLVFSIFVIFIIQPSLSTAFTLKEEENELRVQDARYEKMISDIVLTQANYQLMRERLPLLTAALPRSPLINALLSDITQAGTTANFAITNMTADEVKLVASSTATLKKVVVDIEGTGSFENIMAFQEALSKQRRLKTIHQLEIGKETFESSGSSQLKIKLFIEGYHL